MDSVLDWRAKGPGFESESVQVSRIQSTRNIRKKINNINEPNITGKLREHSIREANKKK